MLEHLVCFARALSAGGIAVNASNLIDLCRSFKHIQLSDKQGFYLVARTTLISKQADYERFHIEFLKYWDGLRLPSSKNQSENADNSDQPGNEQAQDQRQSQANNGSEDGDTPSYEMSPDQTGGSGDELLLKKDLAMMTPEELSKAREIVRRLAATLATVKSRRSRLSLKGNNIDFRKVLRDNTHFGGEIVNLRYRTKKLKKTRVMLLCDVSGSMDKYSSFLIQLIYAMYQEIADFEVAVFSTRTSVITPYLKGSNIPQVLSDVSEHVHDWSGGTNIGGCIKEFNHYFSSEMNHSKTVMIILSDGWDRGESDTLREEMSSLRRKAHKLIWLNPLLSNPEYKPLVKGMRIALPYLDHFLPVHNIESLENLITTLRSAINN